MVSDSERVTICRNQLNYLLLSHTVGLLGGAFTPHPGWFERGAEQLDALRQPSLYCEGAEPGGVPERFGHLLLHHQTTSAGPGASGVVLP